MTTNVAIPGIKEISVHMPNHDAAGLATARNDSDPSLAKKMPNSQVARTSAWDRKRTKFLERALTSDELGEDRRVQWQVEGGWYIRTPKRLADREPMAVYYAGTVPVGFQYFDKRPTPGVKVLR